MLLIYFLHHLKYKTLITNTNYRAALTIITYSNCIVITILTLTLLIDTITALRKEEQKRWPTYLHSLLTNAKTYRPFYLFTFVIRLLYYYNRVAPGDYSRRYGVILDQVEPRISVITYTNAKFVSVKLMKTKTVNSGVPFLVFASKINYFWLIIKYSMIN